MPSFDYQKKIKHKNFWKTKNCFSFFSEKQKKKTNCRIVKKKTIVHVEIESFGLIFSLKYKFLLLYRK